MKKTTYDNHKGRKHTSGKLDPSADKDLNAHVRPCARRILRSRLPPLLRQCPHAASDAICKGDSRGVILWPVRPVLPALTYWEVKRFSRRPTEHGMRSSRKRGDHLFSLLDRQVEILVLFPPLSAFKGDRFTVLAPKKSKFGFGRLLESKDTSWPGAVPMTAVKR